MAKTKLLIIDEHPAVRHALKVRLHSSPTIEIVAATPTIVEGGANVLAFHPDIVLLGLKGSHNNRLSVTIKAVADLVQQGTAVIILTSYADDVEREMLLKAGARRYLLKDINTPQLLAEINAVIAETAASKSCDETSPRVSGKYPRNITPVVISILFLFFSYSLCL